jgi:Ala-tRNA(Pro) deacylase
MRSGAFKSVDASEPVGDSMKASADVALTNRVSPKKLLLSKWTAVHPERKEKHFLVTIPAASSVSLDRLSVLLGAAGLSFGSPERLLKHLGVTPGSVTLLGLVNDPEHKVQFVMDQALWAAN